MTTTDQEQRMSDPRPASDPAVLAQSLAHAGSALFAVLPHSPLDADYVPRTVMAEDDGPSAFGDVDAGPTDRTRFVADDTRAIEAQAADSPLVRSVSTPGSPLIVAGPPVTRRERRPGQDTEDLLRVISFLD